MRIQYSSKKTYGLRPVRATKPARATSILRMAMRLISNPKRWLKGREAISNYGLSCNANSPKAIRFCALGAIRKFGDTGEAESWLNQTCRGEDIVEINDDPKTSHAKIIRKFGHAIKLASKDRQK